MIVERGGGRLYRRPAGGDDRLAEGVSTFLLGGRGWVVLHIRHEERVVVVEPAPRGRRPTWGWFLPQYLGFTLRQRILAILLGDEPYPYLDPSAADVPRLHRDGERPLVWVRTRVALEEAVAVLAGEWVVGLDVETTLGSRALCRVQIAGRSATYLIDTLGQVGPHR